MPKKELNIEDLNNVDGGVSHEKTIRCPYCGQEFTFIPNGLAVICPHCGCSVEDGDMSNVRFG